MFIGVGRRGEREVMPSAERSGLSPLGDGHEVQEQYYFTVTDVNQNNRPEVLERYQYFPQCLLIYFESRNPLSYYWPPRVWHPTYSRSRAFDLQEIPRLGL